VKGFSFGEEKVLLQRKVFYLREKNLGQENPRSEKSGRSEKGGPSEKSGPPEKKWSSFGEKKSRPEKNPPFR
jgi:hypothetical protein